MDAHDQKKVCSESNELMFLRSVDVKKTWTLEENLLLFHFREKEAQMLYRVKLATNKIVVKQGMQFQPNHLVKRRIKGSFCLFSFWILVRRVARPVEAVSFIREHSSTIVLNHLTLGNVFFNWLNFFLSFSCVIAKCLCFSKSLFLHLMLLTWNKFLCFSSFRLLSLNDLLSKYRQIILRAKVKFTPSIAV